MTHQLMDATRAYRFCGLPYVNALPLVHYIKEAHPSAELIYRTPRSAVIALLEGKAEAALVPIVDCFRYPDLKMIPGLGICADGDVTSVLLQCYEPLLQVRIIGLSPESRTSNALMQVLMRDHFRVSHRVEYSLCDDEVDARVCIGDRALCAAPAAETYDLAGEWKKMTGLPFVFAVWAYARSSTDSSRISRILYRAKEIGKRSRPALARLCAQRLGLTQERCFDYLTNCIHYDLGPGEREGMNLFRELAANLLEPRVALPITAISSRTCQGVPILKRG